MILAATPAVSAGSTRVGNKASQEIKADATDASYFSVQKTILYDQTAANTTALDARQPYQFSSNLQGGSTGVVLSSSSVTPPTPGTGTVAFQTEGGQPGLYFQTNFTTQSALDAAFPIGSYGFAIQTSTPNTYTTAVTLGSAIYPTVPQITSVTYGPNNTPATWSNGILVVPDNTHAITFNWVNSGTGNAYFQINNSDVSSSGNSLSNTFTIAANALPNNNTTYQGSINVSNGTGGPSSIPGINDSASDQTQVDFYLQVGTPSSSTAGLYFSQKTHVQVQSSNNAPVDGAGDTDGYDPAPYDITTQAPIPGTVTGPSSSSYLLTSNGSNSNYRYRSSAFTSSASLNAAAPDGTYTYPGIGGSATLSGTGTGNGYPTAAQITKVNNATPVWDAQGQLVLDPTIDNTITWSAVPVNLATNGHETVQFDGSNGNGSLISLQAGLTQSSTTPITQMLIAAGTMTITNTYIGNIDYTQASSFNTITAGTTYAGAGYQTKTDFAAVALKPQTITFGTIPTQALSAGTYTLSASASSGLPITFSVVSGPATVSGDVLTFTGSGSVTVAASQIGDGTYASVPATTQSFTISAPTPLTFTQWEQQYFTLAQMGNPAISGLTADPQNDGVPNLLKYLYDINPAAPMAAADRAALAVTGTDTTTTPGTEYLTATYRQYGLKTGVTFRVQTSTDLQTWTTVTPDLSQQIGTVATNGDAFREVGVIVPPTTVKQFIRLDVTQP